MTRRRPPGSHESRHNRPPNDETTATRLTPADVPALLPALIGTPAWHLRARCGDWWLTIPLVLALVGLSSEVRASPSARLVYARGAATETCPDEAEFRAAVAARVGYDPFFPFAKRSVVTRVDATGANSYRARMEILDERGALLGEKVFLSSSGECGEVVLTLALAVSLAIDVIDVAPTPASTDEMAAAPPPPPVDTAPAPVVEPPPASHVLPDVALPEARPRWQGEGSLRALGTVGLGRAVNLGTSLGAAVRRGRWSLGLEGRLDLASSASIEPRGSVSTSLLGLSVAPCFAPYKLLFACATATAGRIDVESTGIEHPARDSALFLAFGGRVGVELEATSALALRAALDVAAAPVRHVLRVGASDLYETSMVVGSASLGAVVRF